MKGAGKKNAIIILNGISLKKKLFYHEFLPAISGIFNVEVHETLSKNDAKALASKFTEKHVDVILAAGGDGTLNQVINGVLKSRENASNLPVIGLIPIGSGNDFARGAGLKITVDNLTKLLSDFKPKGIDVGIVECQADPKATGTKQSTYFVNVADVGMGPEVVRKLQQSGRPFGSQVAYYKSILNTFLTYKPMVVKAESTEWTWEGKLRTLAVANGRYYGHGLCIAPDAILNDHIFSVFICGNVSILDFIINTPALKKGKKVFMNEVLYKTTHRIKLTSEKPCPVEVDGEIIGWLPAEIKVLDKQLHFLI